MVVDAGFRITPCRDQPPDRPLLFGGREGMVTPLTEAYDAGAAAAPPGITGHLRAPRTVQGGVGNTQLFNLGTIRLYCQRGSVNQQPRHRTLGYEHSRTSWSRNGRDPSAVDVPTSNHEGMATSRCRRGASPAPVRSGPAGSRLCTRLCSGRGASAILWTWLWFGWHLATTKGGAAVETCFVSRGNELGAHHGQPRRRRFFGGQGP